MRENELRQYVVDWAKQFQGIAEHSAQHLALINLFNNSGLCPRYQMTQNDAWCATFVSDAFISNGLAGAPGSGKLFECVECYCDSVIAKAKQQGIWIETDSYIPKIGDCVLYDWDDSGYGENYGSTEHIGLVTSCNGSSFIVIEGNFSNTVGYREMPVNGRYIRGFVAPNYAAFSDARPAEPWKATGTAICTEDEVNLRTEPAGAVVGQLNKGQRFEIDGKTDRGWTHANVAGIGVCWIFSQYVQKDSPVKPEEWKATGTATIVPGVTIDDPVNVRLTPSGQIIGSLISGQRFEIDGKTQSGWWHVNVAGIGIGYIYGAWCRKD